MTEPGADLGLALALASALTGEPVPPDVVACGEVGLGGELRQVSQLGRRLDEAARLGFRRAVVPHSAPAVPDGIQAVRVGSLDEAVGVLGLRPVRRSHPAAGRSEAAPPAPPEDEDGGPRLRAVGPGEIPDTIPDDLFDDPF